MQSFLAILLVGGVLVARAETEQKYLGKTARNIRRQFMSCEETYGESWVPCGSEVCTQSSSSPAMKLTDVT